MRKSLITICFFLSHLLLAAQLPDYHLQYFDYSSGIRPGNIEGLLKDREGFMWIIYPRSVQRFDGQQVRDFKPGLVVINLHCDRKGRLWLSVQGGIQKFNAAKQRFEAVPIDSEGPLPNREVFDLPDGSIWLATSNGFYRYDEKKQHFLLQPDLLPVPPPYSVRSFAVKGYSLFLSRNDKTLRYNVQTKQLDSLPYLSPRKIYPMTEDSVLITSWTIKSYWLNFKQQTVHTAAPPELGDRPFGVRSFAPIDSAHYLIASQQGMFSFDARSKKFRNLVIFNKGEKVNSVDFINHLYSDDEGYVWAASIDGVARFPAKGQLFGLIRIAQQSNGFPAGVNNIRGMVEDDQGNLWMATGHGFVSWNLAQNKMDVYLPDDQSQTRLSYPSVRGIGFDGANLILAPADRGVWLMNTKTKQFRRPLYASPYVKQLSEGDFFDGLTSLQNGNHVLNGRDALYQLKGDSYILDTIDCPAGRENTNFAYQGRDGWVWLTTTRGLHLFDKDMRYQQKVALNGDPQNLSAGFIMKDNALLVATDSGVQVVEYKQGKISTKKYEKALDGKFFTNLYIDINDILWATSDEGIYRYDLKRKRLNLFDYTDNVQGYGFNLNSWLRSKDGMLYLGGINGLNYVQPDQFFDNLQPPPVKISALRLGNDSSIYETSQLIKVPWRARNLSVSFVSPWYNNTAKLHYRYKLDGLDENWHYVGNLQELRFAELEPGTYKLLIESSLNKADWTSMLSPLQFKILTPLWRAWWFILIAIAVLGIAIGWVLRLFWKKQKAENTLMETKNQVAEIEMQALRAQMNPHFIFNCLNSINRYIVKSDQATASLYLTRFAKLIRLILDNSNNKSVSLSNELEAMRLYIEMETIRFEKQFTYSIKVAPDIDTEAIQVPPMIIQPFVENAIWHGLLHKESPGHLSVELSCKNAHVLECRIQDNGIGRARAKELKSKSASTRKSLGMKITEDRLDLLNSQALVSATISVEDLFEPAGEPAGTLVTLKIPLNQ